MNRKLRLLVTSKCPNKCPMCCNNQFDFNDIPVVDRWDYDEIMITGGEPLLFPNELDKLISSIRNISKACGKSPKIFIYTACFNMQVLIDGIYITDGVVLTPHNPLDVEYFALINKTLLRNPYPFHLKSLRLNLFSDMKALLPEGIDLSLWNVHDIKWVKDCPVPEGEDFRRVAKLW